MVLSLIPKRPISKEIQEDVIRILKQTLEEAERGEITTVVVIAQAQDSTWIDRCSNTIAFSEAIGRLEITKQEWIATFLRGEC